MRHTQSKKSLFLGLHGLALLTSLAACLSCSPGLLPAEGSRREVFLLSSQNLQEAAARVLRAHFEKPILYLGRQEKAFNLIAVDETQVEAYLRRSIVILLADVSGRGKVNEVVRHFIAKGPIGSELRVLHDVYAKNQTVIFLQVQDSSDLTEFISGDTTLFDRLVAEVMLDRIHQVWQHLDSEQRDRVNRYGFDLATPKTYRLREHQAGWKDAIELFAEVPSRTVTVFWQDNVGADAARDHEFLLALQRDVMGRLHGDGLLEDSVEWRHVDARLVLKGVWQNAERIAGGLLQSHFTYDPTRQRIYGVQWLLFAPGRDKFSYVQELEAIQRTFHFGVSE